MLDLDLARQQLDESGWFVLPEFISADWLAELQEATERQFQIEGDRAGTEFRQEEGSRRLANLVNKGEVFRRIVVEPTLLKVVVLTARSGVHALAEIPPSRSRWGPRAGLSASPPGFHASRDQG